jgi:hypothetical protein
MVDLKKGPGGHYSHDQWVITENITNEQAGTFNHRCRYLGEADWTTGEPVHDEMLRGVASGDDMKMMRSARVDMIIDGLKANQNVMLNRELQIVITRDGEDSLVYCIGPPSGAILRKVAPGRPAISNDIIQDILDAAMEAAAIQEAVLQGDAAAVDIAKAAIEEAPPAALQTEILCVGCGESKLRCPSCGTSYMEGPDACPSCGMENSTLQIAALAAPVCPPEIAKPHDPSKVTLTKHNEDGSTEKVEMPVPPEFQDLNQTPGAGSGRIAKQEPPQPAPPMTTKPMSPRIGSTPDASATVHRLMAALCTPLNGHAIAAAVLNLCDVHEIDPAEFVEDLRGTLARCAEVWGTNKG